MALHLPIGPVINQAVCVGQKVSSWLEGRDEGVVVLHLPIGPVINQAVCLGQKVSSSNPVRG